MRIRICNIWGQVYITPFIKVTHGRLLNGDLELIVGWLKWELILAI